jgi:hypothetical protein
MPAKSHNINETLDKVLAEVDAQAKNRLRYDVPTQWHSTYYLRSGFLIRRFASISSRAKRITISIYTEQDHAIAIDSRSMSLEELTSKYERVATELARTRNDILTSLQSRTEDIPPGKEYGEPVIGLRSSQGELLYKITATGDDYILLTNSVTPTKRRVFATRCISSINWHDELLFTWSVPHIDKTTDRAKR